MKTYTLREDQQIRGAVEHVEVTVSTPLDPRVEYKTLDRIDREIVQIDMNITELEGRKTVLQDERTKVDVEAKKYQLAGV